MKSKKTFSRVLHAVYHLRRALWKSTENSNFLKIRRRIFWAMIFENTPGRMKYSSRLRSLVMKWDWTVLKDVNKYLFTVGLPQYLSSFNPKYWNEVLRKKWSFWKFAGEFSETLLLSRNFMLIIGVEGMLEKYGPKFQMKSNNHI